MRKNDEYGSVKLRIWTAKIYTIFRAVLHTVYCLSWHLQISVLWTCVLHTFIWKELLTSTCRGKWIACRSFISSHILRCQGSLPVLQSLPIGKDITVIVSKIFDQYIAEKIDLKSRHKAICRVNLRRFGIRTNSVLPFSLIANIWSTITGNETVR